MRWNCMSKAPHFLQITAKQQSKRLNKYGTLWDRDLVSVVRIRESRYYRGFFFKENIWEFCRDIRNCPCNSERCPYRKVRLYWILEFKNLLMCRTFGRVIEVFLPICSFARGKVPLETMSYLTVFDVRHGFRSTLKLSQILARLNGPQLQVDLCETYIWFLQPNTAFSLRPFWQQKAVATYTSSRPNRHFLNWLSEGPNWEEVPK